MVSPADPAPLTDEERVKYFGHHQADDIVANPRVAQCRACSYKWPCPTSRLISDLRAARAEVERLKTELND